MYPTRKPTKKETEITTSIFRSTKKPPLCTCGARLHLITVHLIGPVDERTVTRRYPGIEVCPTCRLADLSRVSRWDWDRIREYLKNEWVPQEPPKEEVEIREK
jgi:hypothetical protein